MALNKEPTFPNRPKTKVFGHTDADAGNARGVIVAADNVAGVKVVGAWATGEETASRNVTVLLYDGADNHVLNTVTVPADAGRDPSVPPVNLFDGLPLPVDADGQPYLFLSAGHELHTQPSATITSTETLSTFAQYATFDNEA